MVKVLKTTACIFSLLVIASCASGSKEAIGKSKTVANATLLWKPTVTAANYTNSALNVYKTVYFEAGGVTNSCQEPEMIGYVLIDKKIALDKIPLHTAVNIETWCAKGVTESLRIIGMKTGLTNSAIVIDADITSLGSDEQSAYHGEITLRISAHKGDGMLVWEGMVKGEANIPDYATDRVGYSQALSDAVVNGVYNLLTETSFMDAVVKSSVDE